MVGVKRLKVIGNGSPDLDGVIHHLALPLDSGVLLGEIVAEGCCKVNKTTLEDICSI